MIRLPVLALATIFTISACSSKEKVASKSENPSTTQETEKPAKKNTPFDTSLIPDAYRLHISGFSIVPGTWVDSTAFSRQDTSEPVLLGESLSDDGIRIRSFIHLANDFEWISTNKGMPSPDGPYWISQVRSKMFGASFDSAISVGGEVLGIQGDTDLVSQSGILKRTVCVRSGKIAELMLLVQRPTAISAE